MALLEVKNLTKNFGGLTAVGDVSMELNEGELVGLIGPNGAGKTTLFNLLTGVYEPSEGTVTLDGTVLNGKAPYKIASLGLSRTFQNIRLFKDMTVLENVLVGLSNKQPSNFFASLLRLPKYYSSEEELKAKAMKLLAIFNLDGEADTLAKNLAYGQQRHLEIVRALATEPKILFLDEPAAGMNPQETAELTAHIRQIQKDFGITIILIEHDMSLVMDVTERIYVLEYGRLIAEGTPDEIKNNKRVIEAYLGGEAMAMLKVENLSIKYGSIEAVKNVSFEVNEGEVVTLIGANGAGKTSILRTISGLVRPTEGTISYLGNDIHKTPARKIVAEGLAQVPEGRHVFAGLTVMENLEMGAFLHTNKEENTALLKKVFQRFPRLEERKNQDAATLSGGEQQMLAMGRALMSRPKLLLLDEPSMGLAPIFIQEIFDIIEDIKAQGTTVLLIEQNANKALSIADRGYVLETGKVVLSGTGEELLASDEVRKAYLGG